MASEIDAAFVKLVITLAIQLTCDRISVLHILYRYYGYCVYLHVLLSHFKSHVFRI